MCEETREEKRRHVAAERRGAEGSTSILDFFLFNLKINQRSDFASEEGCPRVVNPGRLATVRSVAVGDVRIDSGVWATRRVFVEGCRITAGTG